MTDWFDELAAKKRKADEPKASQAQQRKDFEKAANVFFHQLYEYMLPYVERYNGGRVDLRFEANTLEVVSHAHGTTALPNVSITGRQKNRRISNCFYGG